MSPRADLKEEEGREGRRRLERALCLGPRKLHSWVDGGWGGH